MGNNLCNDSTVVAQWEAVTGDDIRRTFRRQQSVLHLWLGGGQGVVVVFFIILNLFMIKYVCRRIDRTPSTTGYKLVLVVAIFDIIQLLVHLYAGILMAIGRGYPRHTEIAGAILAAGWDLQMISTLLVTLYRLLVVRFPHSAICRLLSRNSAFYTVLVVKICLFCTILVIYFTGLNKQVLTEYGWAAADDYPLSGIFLWFDDFGTPLLSSISLFLYIIIFRHVVVNKKLDRMNDVRWALQTFCFCLFSIGVSIEWTWAYDCFPPTFISLYVQNALWPLWNGANVVCFFAFQRDPWDRKKSFSMVVKAAANLQRPSLVSPVILLTSKLASRASI